VWSLYQVSNKTNTTSLDTHIKDILIGISSFLHSPVVGHGIGNYADTYIQFGGGEGSSTGILAVAAQGGILLLLIYLIPILLSVIRGLSQKEITIIIFAGILLVTFTVIVLDNNPLFAFYLAFCLFYYSMVDKRTTVRRGQLSNYTI
jgi:glycerol-3-phosphate acyltransferase PlsY